MAASFEELAKSRRDWIEEILKTWCMQADRKNLLLAELEWLDIAGKVDPSKTLWAWAWSRFPNLVHPDLGLDETHRVSISLRDGTSHQGHPDARKSARGMLLLFDRSPKEGFHESGPFSIDEVQSVIRLGADSSGMD